MSEFTPPSPNSKSRENNYDQFQYKDGHIGLGINTPGERVVWDEYTHTDSLSYRGSRDVAIVTMDSGRSFAIGRGLSAMLPSTFDTETGKFDITEKKFAAKAIEEDDLPDVEIGKPWEMIDDKDPVQSVIVRYKNTTPGRQGFQQVDSINPFEHANDILDIVADRMEEVTGRPVT